MTAGAVAAAWTGSGSLRLTPPPPYWADLEGSYPTDLLDQVRSQRVNEFRAGDLGSDAAVSLLDQMVEDGWLERKTLRTCTNPTCEEEPSDLAIATGHCSECDVPITAESVELTIYVRNLAPTRDVDWVVVIHGMNTKGAWQEEFSWFLGTTWGKSVPVAIYKYGIIIAGVIMAWRRRKLQRQLRARIAELRTQARAAGYGGVPDVIAHSFGTWLLGHLLEDEVHAEDPLQFGRVILTGCVLRPDYDWGVIKEANLVGEVLNHYATRDPIVPLAHWTIWDSGPSGRRGFDNEANVINIRAEGLKHSDLFSTDRCIINGQQRQKCPENDSRGSRHLDYTYARYWRPFLTLPATELRGLDHIVPPARPWRQAIAPLRGTLFPLFVLPLVLALALLGVGGIGGPLSRLLAPIGWVAAGCGAGVLVLLLGIGATLARRHFGRRRG